MDANSANPLLHCLLWHNGKDTFLVVSLLLCQQKNRAKFIAKNSTKSFESNFFFKASKREQTIRNTTTNHNYISKRALFFILPHSLLHFIHILCTSFRSVLSLLIFFVTIFCAPFVLLNMNTMADEKCGYNQAIDVCYTGKPY